MSGSNNPFTGFVDRQAKPHLFYSEASRLRGKLDSSTPFAAQLTQQAAPPSLHTKLKVACWVVAVELEIHFWLLQEMAVVRQTAQFPDELIN